jgi:hypothetical protein
MRRKTKRLASHTRFHHLKEQIHLRALKSPVKRRYFLLTVALICAVAAAGLCEGTWIKPLRAKAEALSKVREALSDVRNERTTEALKVEEDRIFELFCDYYSESARYKLLSDAFTYELWVNGRRSPKDRHRIDLKEGELTLDLVELIKVKDGISYSLLKRHQKFTRENLLSGTLFRIESTRSEGVSEILTEETHTVYRMIFCDLKPGEIITILLLSPELSGAFSPRTDRIEIFYPGSESGAGK